MRIHWYDLVTNKECTSQDTLSHYIDKLPSSDMLLDPGIPRRQHGHELVKHGYREEIACV